MPRHNTRRPAAILPARPPAPEPEPSRQLAPLGACRTDRPSAGLPPVSADAAAASAATGALAAIATAAAQEAAVAAVARAAADADAAAQAAASAAAAAASTAAVALPLCRTVAPPAKTTDLERKSLELHGRLIHHSKMPLAMAPGRSVRPKSSGAGFALRNAWRPARSPEQFLLRVGLPVCGRRCSLLLRHSGDGLRRLRDEARIGGS